MIDRERTIRDWLRDQLDKAGRGGKTRLAAHLGVRPDAITRMLNDDPGKEARRVSADELIKMADFFGATPPAMAANPLKSEVKAASDRMVGIHVAGSVRAGVFKEVDQIAAEAGEEDRMIYLPADPLFPSARLVAFDVEGDSMNALKPRPILPGDRIICVAFEDIETDFRLRDGLVVVVERTRAEGMMREWSVKQIELYQDRTEFHPRSTNPANKVIVVPLERSPDSTEEVRIIGLVRRVVNDLPG